MKNICYYILGILLFVLCDNVHGTNYYLSNMGHDTNVGTSVQKPWKSLDKINSSKFYPGDSILFRCGDEFSGTIIIPNSGTEQHPIVFSSYGYGAKPKFNGFERLNSWESLGNGIFKAYTKAKNTLNVVSIDGINQRKGRHPNDSYWIFESATKTSLTDSKLTGSTDWTGATVVLKTSRFTLENRKINSHSNNTINFDAVDYSFATTNGYFITDDLQTLDEIGEWYIKNGEFYIYTGGSDPDKYNVQVSKTDTFALLRYKKFVEFLNLNIVGYNEQVFTINSSNNISIKDCDVNFSGNYVVYGGSNWGASSDRLVVKNCTISNTNTCPIILYDEFSNAVLENNYINNSGMIPGMKKEDGKYGAIATWQTDGLVIKGNTIINTGFNPISFIGDNIKIIKNYIDTFCTVLDDGAGIYTYSGSQADDNDDFLIDGNIVLNGIGASDGTKDRESAAFGIYLDDATDYTKVLNNTVYNCSYGGLYLHNNQNITVENNLLLNNKYQLYINHGSRVPTMPIRNVIFKNNCLISYNTMQRSVFYVTVEDVFNSIGSFDNNIYYSLKDNNPKFTVSLNGWGHAVDYNIKEWSNLISDEKQSIASLPVKEPLAYYFVYNTQNISENFPLPYVQMIDSKKRIFDKNILLMPFSSVFLFKSESDTLKQVIDLKKGWNIISSYLIPANSNIFEVFLPLIENDLLIQVQDQNGNTLEFVPNEGWKNNIDPGKGILSVKVNVKDNCSLMLTGSQPNYPMTINLNEGWNILPFPYYYSKDVNEIVGKYLNNNTLIKFKDQYGRAIEKINNSEFNNSIKTLHPGEGYEIRVSQITTLTYY
ncbi:right-handed parallel beta-helix repeat-containing protein [Saccharicrinis sp. FJH54]|uniref:right-handed parallel beta-helix repeat-containing protein n=1 Tax=Saccharicrinis sp. FJH54 TaxID=3344665 RepID=UPI0035D466E6